MVKQNAQIECVGTIEHESPYQRITHIGGYGSRPWKITLGNAIYFVERDLWDFHVAASDGTPDRLVVATHSDGTKYLKTEADGDEPATLLNLPECI